MSLQQYDKTEPSSIQSLFDHIAHRYDLGNAVLSLQMHRLWNRRLVREVIASQPPSALLDLCCGSGEIAFRYLQSAGKGNAPHTYLVDFSSEMLRVAKTKAESSGLGESPIEFIQGDAMAIPLETGSVDCAVIAYGIRNVKDPAKCLSEVYRVLKPGGRLGILELTRPTNSVLRVGHAAYLGAVVPLVGRLITSNPKAYRYLCQSIHSFIPPDQLQKAILAAGFDPCEVKPLSGGIATLFHATRP